MSNTDNLIQEILEGIQKGKESEYFISYIHQLSQRTTFLASTISNEHMYRIRRIPKNRLFAHTDELKYPPQNSSKIGRLNKEGESIAYLSLGEIAPLVELDISYYEIHCQVKIEYSKKEVLFYHIGVKGKYQSNDKDAVKVNEFYMNALNNKDNKYYNFTIALGNYFLRLPIVDKKGANYPCGLIYSSAQNDKSNKNMYNVAIKPSVFDEYFRIKEASCQVLTLDQANDKIVLVTLNKGTIDNSGQIYWKHGFEEMMSKFHNEYQEDIFIKNGHIIHFKHGVGKIIKTEDDNYTVEFPNGKKVIHQSKISCV